MDRAQTALLVFNTEVENGAGDLSSFPHTPSWRGALAQGDFSFK
jgi:hypothetical protein